MKTKAHVRFLNRAARFDADVELVDVMAVAIKNGRMTPASGDKLLEFIDARKHPRLSKHRATDHNRGLAVSHLKSTLCGAFMKDLYEDLTAYLKELVACAARHGISPDRLIGEHKMDIAANDLLRAGNWDGVVALVADSLFRRLENERSTDKLLIALDKKLGLQVDPKVITAALPFIEMRHLLVHADGLADARFCSAFPALGLKAGEALDIGYKTVKEASRTILALVAEYDSKAVAVKLLGDRDLQH